MSPIWYNSSPGTLSVGDLDGAVCLMDDILIHGKSQEEHNRKLIEVLERLREAGITRSMYSASEVSSFLGQIIDKNGVKPDPKRLELSRR